MPTSGPSSHIWRLISQRESARLEYSLSTPSNHPSPQHIFYSVQQSLRNGLSNRYPRILAYDRTAVQVHGEGYLNANVVCDGRNGWWVAAQAPVESSMCAFFRAIYTRSASAHPALALMPGKVEGQRRAILVQLTGWEENGEVKAAPYFSSVPGETQSFKSSLSSFSINLTPLAQTPLPDLHSVYSDCILSSPFGEDMLLSHYFFEAWPDHGVRLVKLCPPVSALVKLIKEVCERREEYGGEGCEVWVHCSAGVGRTGTFIALSSLLGRHGSGTWKTESALGRLPRELEQDAIARTVDGIREWRGMLIYFKEQMGLIYKIMGEGY